MEFLLTVSIDDDLPIEEQRLRARAVATQLAQVPGIDLEPDRYVNPFYYASSLPSFVGGGEGNGPDTDADADDDEDDAVLQVSDPNIGRIATLADDVHKYGSVYHKGTRVRITCQSPYSPGCYEVIGIDARGKVLYDYAAAVAEVQASLCLENISPDLLIWE